MGNNCKGKFVRTPQTHHQDHALLHGSSHAGQSTVLGEIVSVAKGLLLSSAELGGDRVASHAGDVGVGLRNDFAVLDVEALDLAEGAGVSTVISEELRHNSEGLGGVDNLARPVERSVAHAVRVEVTAVRITLSRIAVGRVCATAVIPIAHRLSWRVAWVRSDRIGDAVGFPDIHLSAARAVVANPSVGVVRRRLPALDVSL